MISRHTVSSFTQAQRKFISIKPRSYITIPVQYMYTGINDDNFYRYSVYKYVTV